MNKLKPSEEQLKFASVLQSISLGGLGVLLLGFAVYVSGILQTFVPASRIPQYWGLRVDEFIEQTGMPTGWDWVPLLNHGDMVSNIGIVLLAATSMLSFAVILPTFLKKKDTAYSVIIVLQILVLFLAASGIIVGE